VRSDVVGVRCSFPAPFFRLILGFRGSRFSKTAASFPPSLF
jgi:hypothetical protein